MFEVVLINPEIPQNTGNIARTVLSQKCRLHLVKPYGFRLDTAAVKRAGVDYWKFVEITEWDSKDDFFAGKVAGLSISSVVNKKCTKMN